MLSYLRGEKPKTKKCVDMGRGMISFTAMILVLIGFYVDGFFDNYTAPYKTEKIAQPEVTTNDMEDVTKRSKRHDFMKEIAEQNSSNIFDNSTALVRKVTGSDPTLTEFIIVAALFSFAMQTLSISNFETEQWDSKLRFTAIFCIVLCIMTNTAATAYCALIAKRVKRPPLTGGCILSGLLIVFEIMDLCYFILRRNN